MNLLKHYKNLRNDESRKKGSFLPAAPRTIDVDFLQQLTCLKPLRQVFNRVKTKIFL